MRLRTALVVFCVSSAIATIAPAAEPALESDEDKVFYTLGLVIAQNLVPLELNETELAKVQAGLSDGALGRDPRVVPEEYAAKIDGVMRERMAAVTEREKEAGLAFQAKAAEESGAVKSDSGLVYRELTAGAGPSPSPEDTVKVHYHGTLRDGSVFDSSLDRGEPATFALNGVIGCFSEGVGKMKVGGKSKLTCPPEIAYGERGSAPRIRPGATLVFEIELLEIVAQPEPAPNAP